MKRGHPITLHGKVVDLEAARRAREGRRGFSPSLQKESRTAAELALKELNVTDPLIREHIIELATDYSRIYSSATTYAEQDSAQTLFEANLGKTLGIVKASDFVAIYIAKLGAGMAERYSP